MSWKVLQGDAFEMIDQIETPIQACVTDPPYGIDFLGKKWDKQVPGSQIWQKVYDKLDDDAYLLSFSAPRTYHRTAIEIEEAGFEIVDMIQWIVTTKMAGKNKLKPTHEPIVVARKGKPTLDVVNTRVPWNGKPPTGWIKGGASRRYFGETGDKEKASAKQLGTEDADPTGRYPANVIGLFDDTEHQKYFYAPRATRKEKGENNNHPTAKPISLMRYLVRLVTKTGDTVLDPFNGSGSTGIGALAEGRKYIGIEMDENYANISKARLEEAGQTSFDKLFEYEKST